MGARRIGKNATPSTVIRGGFGIFYDRFSEQNVLIAQRYNGINQQQFVIINPDTYPGYPFESELEARGTQQIVHTISSSLRAPYLMQSSIGVERQLPKKTTLAVTYTNSHGLHELRSRNINAPLPDGAYPYPDEGPIYEMESAGLYNQNLLLTNINSRLTPKISLLASYSLAYARSNTDGLNTFPANQYSMAGEYGPAANDIRNRASLGGSITSKLGLVWNPFDHSAIGRAVQHHHQPGYLQRYGSHRAAGIRDQSKPAGRDCDVVRAVRSRSGAGRDDRAAKLWTGPGTVHCEPTSGAHLHPPRARQAHALRSSARNLLNHLNPGPIIGNINSPLFGQSNQMGGGFGAYADGANNRRLEFQARFAF